MCNVPSQRASSGHSPSPRPPSAVSFEVHAAIARALEPAYARALEATLASRMQGELTLLLAMSDEEWRAMRLAAGLNMGQMSRVKLELEQAESLARHALRTSHALQMLQTSHT